MFAAAAPPAQPENPLGIGRVDLLSLAAAMSAETAPPDPLPEAGEIPTLRELHLRVDAFLENEMKTALARSRWRLASASQNAAIDRGQNWGANDPGILIALAFGAIGQSLDTKRRDAEACAAFLDGLDRRLRALADDIPETAGPAPPGLLARWERLRAELSQNLSCRRKR